MSTNKLIAKPITAELVAYLRASFTIERLEVPQPDPNATPVYQHFLVSKKDGKRRGTFWTPYWAVYVPREFSTGKGQDRHQAHRLIYAMTRNVPLNGTQVIDHAGDVYDYPYAGKSNAPDNLAIQTERGNMLNRKTRTGKAKDLPTGMFWTAATERYSVMTSHTGYKRFASISVGSYRTQADAYIIRCECYMMLSEMMDGRMDWQAVKGEEGFTPRVNVNDGSLVMPDDGFYKGAMSLEDWRKSPLCNLDLATNPQLSKMRARYSEFKAQ